MMLEMTTSNKPYKNLNRRPNQQIGSCEKQTLDGRQGIEIDHLVNFSDKFKNIY